MSDSGKPELVDRKPANIVWGATLLLFIANLVLFALPLPAPSQPQITQESSPTNVPDPVVTPVIMTGIAVNPTLVNANTPTSTPSLVDVSIEVTLTAAAQQTKNAAIGIQGADNFSGTITAIQLGATETALVIAQTPATPTPTASSTATFTPTTTPTETATVTDTPTQTATLTATATASITDTPTRTSAPLQTPPSAGQPTLTLVPIETASTPPDCPIITTSGNTNVYAAPVIDATKLLTLTSDTGLQLLGRPRGLSIEFGQFVTAGDIPVMLPIQYLDTNNTPQTGWVESNQVAPTSDCTSDRLNTVWEPAQLLGWQQGITSQTLRINDEFIPGFRDIPWVEVERLTSNFAVPGEPPSRDSQEGIFLLQARVITGYDLDNPQPNRIVYQSIANQVNQVAVSQFVWQAVFLDTPWTQDARVGLRFVVNQSNGQVPAYFEVVVGRIRGTDACAIFFRQNMNNILQEIASNPLPNEDRQCLLSVENDRPAALRVWTTGAEVRVTYNGRNLVVFPLPPELAGQPGELRLVIENVSVRFTSILIAGQ